MIKRILDIIKFFCEFNKKKECEAFRRVLEIERQVAILENEMTILKEKYKKILEIRRVENATTGKEKKEDIDISSIIADLQSGADLQTVLTKHPKLIEYILKKIL